MVGWTKGPKCNILNCPSRLWTVIDGRQVCKNGHVSEQALVVSDDEELQGFTMKKVRQPTQSQSEAPAGNLAGMDLAKARARAYALMFREMVRTLQDLYQLPASIQSTARTLFIKLTNASGLNPTLANKRNIGMLDLICLLWLTLYLHEVPVYMVDLFRLVRSEEIPYRSFQTFAAKSPELKAAIDAAAFPVPFNPLYYSKDVWARCLTICSMLEITLKTRNMAPLVYKLVRDLMLPPAVYHLAVRLTALISKDQRRKYSYTTHERSSVQAVCIATKALYHIHSSKNQTLDSPEWDIWKDMMLKVWVFEDMSEELHPSHIPFCDNETMDRFLAVYQNSWLIHTKEPNIGTRQLHNMFPLEPLPEPDTVDLELHKELMAALYCEVELQHGSLDEIGKGYRIYQNAKTSQWVLPPVIEVLYRVCSSFLLVDPDTFRYQLPRAEDFITYDP